LATGIRGLVLATPVKTPLPRRKKSKKNEMPDDLNFLGENHGSGEGVA
jgi:hypothetical protein